MLLQMIHKKLFIEFKDSKFQMPSTCFEVQTVFFYKFKKKFLGDKKTRLKVMCWEKGPNKQI